MNPEYKPNFKLRLRSGLAAIALLGNILLTGCVAGQPDQVQATATPTWQLHLSGLGCQEEQLGQCIASQDGRNYGKCVYNPEVQSYILGLGGWTNKTACEAAIVDLGLSCDGYDIDEQEICLTGADNNHYRCRARADGRQTLLGPFPTGYACENFPPLIIPDCVASQPDHYEAMVRRAIPNTAEIEVNPRILWQEVIGPCFVTNPEGQRSAHLETITDGGQIKYFGVCHHAATLLALYTPQEFYEKGWELYYLKFSVRAHVAYSCESGTPKVAANDHDDDWAHAVILYKNPDGKYILVDNNVISADPHFAGEFDSQSAVLSALAEYAFQLESDGTATYLYWVQTTLIPEYWQRQRRYQPYDSIIGLQGRDERILIMKDYYLPLDYNMGCTQ